MTQHALTPLCIFVLKSYWLQTEGVSSEKQNSRFTFSVPRDHTFKQALQDGTRNFWLRLLEGSYDALSSTALYLLPLTLLISTFMSHKVYITAGAFLVSSIIADSRSIYIRGLKPVACGPFAAPGMKSCGPLLEIKA